MFRNEGVYMANAKAALRLTVDDYDNEILRNVQAALNDLQICGVILPDVFDPSINDAVCTFCKFNMPFLADGEYDRLKRAYDERKAMLKTATGYTNWGRSH